MDDRLGLGRTRIAYIDTSPRPRTLNKKFNDAIQELRVYGKGANKNKRVVRCLFWTRPQFML